MTFKIESSTVRKINYDIAEFIQRVHPKLRTSVRRHCCSFGRPVSCCEEFSSRALGFVLVVSLQGSVRENISALGIMDSSSHGQAQGQHEGAESTTQKTADLTAFVQNLLLQMQTRFQTMSESIITKIDEMGSRIDELERSIVELVKESGHADAVPSPPSNSSYQELRGGSIK